MISAPALAGERMAERFQPSARKIRSLPLAVLTRGVATAFNPTASATFCTQPTISKQKERIEKLMMFR
jgi:hypothetical protein